MKTIAADELNTDTSLSFKLGEVAKYLYHSVSRNSFDENALFHRVEQRFRKRLPKIHRGERDTS